MLNINNIFTFIKSIIYNYYKYLINNVILWILTIIYNNIYYLYNY